MSDRRIVALLVLLYGLYSLGTGDLVQVTAVCPGTDDSNGMETAQCRTEPNPSTVPFPSPQSSQPTPQMPTSAPTPAPTPLPPPPFTITATTYTDDACQTVNSTTTVIKSGCEDKNGTTARYNGDPSAFTYKSFNVGGSCERDVRTGTGGVTRTNYAEIGCAGAERPDSSNAPPTPDNRCSRVGDGSSTKSKCSYSDDYVGPLVSATYAQCWSGGSASTFATNLKYSSSTAGSRCKAIGCAANQCMKTTKLCSNPGSPTPAPTTAAPTPAPVPLTVTTTTYTDDACQAVDGTPTVLTSGCEDKNGTTRFSFAYKSYNVGGSCERVTATYYAEVGCDRQGDQRTDTIPIYRCRSVSPGGGVIGSSSKSECSSSASPTPRPTPGPSAVYNNDKCVSATPQTSTRNPLSLFLAIFLILGGIVGMVCDMKNEKTAAPHGAPGIAMNPIANPDAL
jgi:hypothetical protein